MSSYLHITFACIEMQALNPEMAAVASCTCVLLSKDRAQADLVTQKYATQTGHPTPG